MYHEQAERLGYKVIPCVIDGHGGLAPKFRLFVQKIVNLAPIHTHPAEFRNYLVGSIAVALAKGNVLHLDMALDNCRRTVYEPFRPVVQ